MAVRLVVAKGADEGCVFDLVEGHSMVIGRSANADIVLHDTGISRQHCRVRMENGIAYLADLNSKNGSFVNGNAVTIEMILNDCEEVTLGFSTLEVHITDDQEKSYDIPAQRLAEAEAAEHASRSTEMPLSVSFAEIDIPETLESHPVVVESIPPGDDSEEFIDLTPPAGIRPVPQAQPPRKNDPLIGRVVAGYRIDEFLREEDVSHVYTAFQISMERRVCMKVLSPTLTDDADAVHRFIQTARAAGKLTHPNIFQVYDAGEEDGINFIAVELVDGMTLGEYVQRRNSEHVLPVKEALDLTEQIGDAMAYAHAQGVTHGSLTVENIYVTPHHVAKLTDLGFSKNLSDSGIERPDNPYFTAPEQLAVPDGASPIADVYSLGAVLFVMLTGRMPFRGNSTQEVLERVRAGRHETVRRLRREVPVELGGFVDRAMALKPHDRPADATRFLEDLRQLRSRLRI